ncbi:restriction endonuclease subunit S [Acinetobacter tianfuensis]|uniref:Restriction endonuclease subunit S n=1 Tax=Acinetobacter tianfuensis TaxID=2419603 RepID=A0A3A8EPE7_9GAMM|nr:restriction endonuclease subunit S [Acinetobacter tianfuensis]RKG30731.1 restriction endonuclease subunit S [Acinetobacter tianfuensis]
MSVPKLRFKEFDGDWSNKKIGNIASKVGSGSTPRGGAEAYTDHGIIFIRSQNVNNDQLLLDDVAYIPEETHVKMSGSKVIANDILLNITGASIGRSCVVPHYFTEANVNQHVCIIRTPNDDPIFVQSFLSSENGQNAIQSKQAGGGREGLNFQAIRSIDFHFPPSKEEQTKIASFLSKVDEKISQLTQKHALLSQYKQGMMQKLFSQQIRFKADDGSEFGEWEKVKLGSLLIKHDEKTEFNNQYPVLTSSRHGIYFQKDYFAGQDVASADTTGYNVVPYDYFTYRHMSDDLVFKFNINTICPKGIVSTLYPVFTVKDEHLNKYFLQTILNEGQEFKNFAIMQKQGGSRTYMYFSKLSELVLTIPCLEEQTKIANFLSSIDQKIEVVAEQIEQAKTWKKGLLQQMFV